MWVFMSNSFLSIVAHRDNPNLLLVRARAAGDIEAVFPEATVERTPKADYLYRASLPRSVVSAALAAEVEQIDYTNFKNSVPDPDRHDSYFRAYSVMAGFGRR